MGGAERVMLSSLSPRGVDRAAVRDLSIEAAPHPVIRSPPSPRFAGRHFEIRRVASCCAIEENTLLSCSACCTL